MNKKYHFIIFPAGNDEPESKSPAAKQSTKKVSAKASDDSKKRKKPKDSSESEDEDITDTESESSEEQVNGRTRQSEPGRKVPDRSRGKSAAQGKVGGRSSNKSTNSSKVNSGKRGRPRKA